MSSPRRRKTESTEIAVAKINAKQAIAIAAVGLIAALATPFVTSRLLFKREPVSQAAVQEEIGFYKGRYSTIDETIRENLKTIKNFKESLSASRDCKDLKCRQELELVRDVADRISSRLEAENEQLGKLNKQHLEQLGEGAFVEASQTRLKANTLIIDGEMQTAEDQRRLAAILTTNSGDPIAKGNPVDPVGAVRLLNSPITAVEPRVDRDMQRVSNPSDDSWDDGGACPSGASRAARNIIPLKRIPGFGGVQPYQSNSEQLAMLSDKHEKIHHGTVTETPLVYPDKSGLSVISDASGSGMR